MSPFRRKILYNLFLYFSVRDITYFFYVFYLAGISFFILMISGYAYEYFFSDYPILNNRALSFSMSLLGIALIMFSRNFLNMQLNLPKINILLKLFFLLYTLFMIAGQLSMAGELLKCFITLSATLGVIKAPPLLTSTIL